MSEEQALPPIVLNPPMHITLIKSVSELPLLAAFLAANAKEAGWDIETTPLKDFYYRRMRTMQFGTRTQQVVVDLLGLVNNRSDVLYDCQGNYGKNLPPGLKAFVDIIAPYVCGREMTKVGVNLGFEYMMCYWLLGLRTQGFFDCSVVERCIWAGAHALKDYAFFGMEEMIGHYFGRAVEKELQTSFNLTDPLTEAQVMYAALDTRLPLLLKQAQEYVIRGNSRSAIPSWIKVPAFVCGDNLETIVRIENNAIGAFQDMAVHGDCLDIPRWTAKIDKRLVDLVTSLAELDGEFIPYVGTKEISITQEMVDTAEAAWKTIKLSKTMPAEERELRNSLKAEHVKVRQARAAMVEKSEKCQGQAMINYNSPTQLKAVLHQVPGLERLKSTAADILEKYEHIPICKALSTYRKIAKEISTYGMSWCREWVNEPSNEEGWLNPADHRLHPRYNQYDAETGRSSSDGPNGQNLPHDPETRACFIAGPPDEEIADLRNSKCCGVRAEQLAEGLYRCEKCGKGASFGETEPESYVLLTIDMSGAELRILAEEANDPLWIKTFNEGGDVHSVCGELIYEEEWPKLACVGGEIYFDVEKNKEIILPPCAYYALRPDGKAQHFKCKCPEHNHVRNDLKPTNFGIPYGLGPRGLAIQLKKDEATAKALLKKHEEKNPIIWRYVKMSGKRATDTMKSFDMFGRRRLFTEPTYQAAVIYAQEHQDDFDEPMTVKSALRAMYGNIERQGKNHPIQSANATIIKLAMGSGSDKHGKEFLWHVLPVYGAKLLALIHDELKIRCLKSNAETVAERTQDAIIRAAAEKMKRVQMTSEFIISTVWRKP